MSHIVIDCPQTKLYGRLHHLHTSDETSVRWLDVIRHMKHKVIRQQRVDYSDSFTDCCYLELI